MSPPLLYLDRLKGINKRFSIQMKKVSDRLPVSKRGQFWDQVLKACKVGLDSIDVPPIVHGRGSPE